MHTRKILADFNCRFRLDAIFFHTQVTALLSPDWLERIPSIISLDATPRQYDRLGASYQHKTGPAWLEYGKWRLNRDCFRKAKHLVTWSEWACDGLVDEYEVPGEKISIIPPGVDTKSWACPFDRSPHLGPIRILFVGGNLERKGGKILLEAFRYFRAHPVISPNNRNHLELELHLVTRDAVLPEPGVFVYQTMQPNDQALKDLFFQADIFCLPTQGDCLPMALSEAGAAGLPSVSTRLAAIPEIIRDGETGFLIEPGNVGELITVLQRLIQHPELRLCQGRRAEQVIRQAFDAEQNAYRVLNLMKQLRGKL